MRRFLLLLPLVGCATVPQTGHRLKPAVSPELQRDLDRVVENMPKDNEGAGVKSGITRINVGDYPELEAQLVEVEVMVMEKLSVDLEHPAYALDLIQVGSRLGYRAMDADTGMVIEEGELVNNELVAGELPVPAFCTESSRGALNCEGRLTFRRSGDDGLSARLDYLVPQMLQTGPTCRAALGRDNASPLDSPAALGPEEERAVGQETTSTNLPGAGNANTANGTPLPRLPSILKQIIIPLTGDGRNVLVASTFGDSVVVYSRAGGEPVHLVGDSVQVAEWMYYPEAVGAMVEHLRKLEGALETRPHETVGLEVKFSAMLRGNASKLPAQIHASVGQTTVAKQYSAGRSSSVVGIQGPTTATMTARRGIFNVQYSAPTYNNTAMADLFFDSGADTVANQTMVDLPGDEDNLLVEGEDGSVLAFPLSTCGIFGLYKVDKNWKERYALRGCNADGNAKRWPVTWTLDVLPSGEIPPGVDLEQLNDPKSYMETPWVLLDHSGISSETRPSTPAAEYDEAYPNAGFRWNMILEGADGVQTHVGSAEHGQEGAVGWYAAPDYAGNCIPVTHRLIFIQDLPAAGTF